MTRSATTSLAALVAIMSVALISPSEAGAIKNCRYVGKNPWSGNVIVEGSGLSNWITVACKRASHQCNREANRKRRKGIIVGACHRAV